MASYVITTEAASFSCSFLGIAYSRGYYSHCGEFSLQGQSSTDRKNISIIGEAGSFAITAEDVSSNNFINYSISAGPTGFFLGVPTPNTTWDLGLTSWDGGASLWDGVNVSYEENANWDRADIALAGSFEISSEDILSGKNWYFSARGTSEFNLEGYEAGLARHIVSSASTADYLVNGQEVLLEKGLSVQLDPASFEIISTPEDLEFIREYRILANSLDFQVSSTGVNAIRSSIATLDEANFNLTGLDAELDPTVGLEAEGADPFYVFGFNTELVVRRNYFLQASTLELEVDALEVRLGRLINLRANQSTFNVNTVDSLLSRHIVATVDNPTEYKLEIPCAEQKIRARAGNFSLEPQQANFQIGSRTTVLSADSAGEFNVVLGTITTFNYNWENQGEFVVTGGDSEAICTEAFAGSIWDNGNTLWDNNYTLWDPYSVVIAKAIPKVEGIVYEATFHAVGGSLTRAPDWYPQVPVIPDPPTWVETGEFNLVGSDKIFGNVLEASGNLYSVQPDPVYLQNIKLTTETANFFVSSQSVVESGSAEFEITGGPTNGNLFVKGIYQPLSRIRTLEADAGSFVIQGTTIQPYNEPSDPPVISNNIIVLPIGTGSFDLSLEEVDSISDQLLTSNCK